LKRRGPIEPLRRKIGSAFGQKFYPVEKIVAGIVSRILSSP
jgi:hypothetical protein